MGKWTGVFVLVGIVVAGRAASAGVAYDRAAAVTYAGYFCNKAPSDG